METEIAYDFGKILTVNGYGRGEKLVNSIPFYVYLINYRQMAGGAKELAREGTMNRDIFCSCINLNQIHIQEKCGTSVGKELLYTHLI